MTSQKTPKGLLTPKSWHLQKSWLLMFDKPRHEANIILHLWLLHLLSYPKARKGWWNQRALRSNKQNSANRKKWRCWSTEGEKESKRYAVWIHGIASGNKTIIKRQTKAQTHFWEEQEWWRGNTERHWLKWRRACLRMNKNVPLARLNTAIVFLPSAWSVLVEHHLVQYAGSKNDVMWKHFERAAAHG